MLTCPEKNCACLKSFYNTTQCPIKHQLPCHVSQPLHLGKLSKTADREQTIIVEMLPDWGQGGQPGLVFRVDLGLYHKQENKLRLFLRFFQNISALKIQQGTENRLVSFMALRLHICQMFGS